MQTMTKDEVIQKLGIVNVEPEVQDEILQNLASTVSGRILNGVYERLSDDDINELERLTDTNDEDAVEWFIKSKFENYDEYAINVENEVINELASQSKQI